MENKCYTVYLAAYNNVSTCSELTCAADVRNLAVAGCTFLCSITCPIQVAVSTKFILADIYAQCSSCLAVICNLCDVNIIKDEVTCKCEIALYLNRSAGNSSSFVSKCLVLACCWERKLSNCILECRVCDNDLNGIGGLTCCGNVLDSIINSLVTCCLAVDIYDNVICSSSLGLRNEVLTALEDIVRIFCVKVIVGRNEFVSISACDSTENNVFGDMSGLSCSVINENELEALGCGCYTVLANNECVLAPWLCVNCECCSILFSFDRHCI